MGVEAVVESVLLGRCATKGVAACRIVLGKSVVTMGAAVSAGHA